MISLSSRRNHYSKKYFTMLHTQSEGTRVRFPKNQSTITNNDTRQVQLAIFLFKKCTEQWQNISTSLYFHELDYNMWIEVLFHGSAETEHLRCWICPLLLQHPCTDITISWISYTVSFLENENTKDRSLIRTPFLQ